MISLQRKEKNQHGIFGLLSVQSPDDFFATLTFVTLEHAYPNPIGSFAPKIPLGTYSCDRGVHQLEHSPKPFETYEVKGVLGHTGLLFHVGNTNADSSGCILVGTQYLRGESGIYCGIEDSQDAFNRFMRALTKSIETLTIEED